MGSIVKDKSRLPFNEGWKAIIEEDGNVELKGHNWQFLKQVVGAHLDKKGLNVGDREVYLHKAVCQALHKYGKGNMCIGEYRGSAHQERTRQYEKDGRIPAGLKRGKPGYDARAWAVWHLSAVDGKLDTRYAQELLRRIGCGTCQSHARKYIAMHPVTVGSPEQVFQWTVGFHNSVNQSTGKPVVSLAQAREIWKA
jgi:hypothetical protein